MVHLSRKLSSRKSIARGSHKLHHQLNLKRNYKDVVDEVLIRFCSGRAANAGYSRTAQAATKFAPPMPFEYEDFHLTPRLRCFCAEPSRGERARSAVKKVDLGLQTRVTGR